MAIKRRPSLSKIQGEISEELAKLGGLVVGFMPGVYNVEGQQRHGFEIRFMLGNNPGVIRVAGLPMKSPTSNKKNAVLLQALAIVRDWLQSAVTARVFSPGFNPLVPHMLVQGTNQTIAEMIAQNNTPMLVDHVETIKVDRG